MVFLASGYVFRLRFTLEFPGFHGQGVLLEVSYSWVRRLVLFPSDEADSFISNISFRFSRVRSGTRSLTLVF